MGALILAFLGPYIALPFYLAILLSVIVGASSIIALFWPRNQIGWLHIQNNDEIIDNISVPRTRACVAQQERYEKLAEHVFRPLSESCTQLDIRINTPNELALDDNQIGEIINSSYFREGREHLIKDLEENVIHPEELHRKILQYNAEVEQFLNVILPSTVRQEFGKIPNLEISDTQNELPNNSVIMYTLLGNLRKYLLKAQNPELFYENGIHMIYQLF